MPTGEGRNTGFSLLCPFQSIEAGSFVSFLFYLLLEGNGSFILNKKRTQFKKDDWGAEAAFGSEEACSTNARGEKLVWVDPMRRRGREGSISAVVVH